MEHFDEISTRPEIRLVDLERYLAGLGSSELFRGRWFVCATAGTTGRRGVFVWDRREWVQVLDSGRTAAHRPAVRVLRLGGPHRRHPRSRTW